MKQEMKHPHTRGDEIMLRGFIQEARPGTNYVWVEVYDLTTDYPHCRIRVHHHALVFPKKKKGKKQ